MTRRTLEITREADLILENMKLQAQTKHHKKVYKKDIADWCIKHCLLMKQAQEWFFDWLKKR